MMGVFVPVQGSLSNPAHFVGYVLAENGCWDWTSLMVNGYGRAMIGGRSQLAHRVFYERHFGTIPAGLQIDHLCRNRACVNPDHLEAVTAKTNTLRSNAKSSLFAKATHCVNGHAFTPDNLDTYSLDHGRRRCRVCQLRVGRDSKRRLRALYPGRYRAIRLRYEAKKRASAKAAA
jgi:hypothetical protein